MRTLKRTSLLGIFVGGKVFGKVRGEEREEKKRRKKEREEREGRLRCQVLLLAATCIRADYIEDFLRF